MYDLLIKNAKVMDGTGADAFSADVAVKDGVICGVGNLGYMESAETVDAAGRSVVPGFIDSHSHADLTAARFPDMENLTAQGVTTVCAGNCGMGAAPLTRYYMGTSGDGEALEKVRPPLVTKESPQTAAVVLPIEPVRRAFSEAYGVSLDWSSWQKFNRHFERCGLGANMMCLVGHSILRIQIMGPDCLRAASTEEIEAMCALLRQCMEEGACGLSYGFDYAPGNWAEDEEILRLAAVVAEYDGLLSAHVQHSGLRRGKLDRGFQPYQGFRELLEIGLKTGARLQVSHLRTPFKPLNDKEAASAAAQALLGLLDEYRAKGVRVGWDVLPNYPVAGEYAPMLASLLQCYVERCGSLTRFGEMLGDNVYCARLRAELAEGKNLGRGELYSFDIDMPGWDAMWRVTRHNEKSYEGKTTRELAKLAGLEPLDMLLRLLETDVRTCIRLDDPGKEYIGFADFIHHPDAAIGLDVECWNYDCNQETRPDMPPVYLGAYSDFSGMAYLLTHPDAADLRREDRIAAMTGRTARNLGLRDRGFVKEGMRADLVLLDWEKLSPSVDYVHPNRAPAGIDAVWVNGRLTAEKGRLYNPRAGRIIRNGDRVHG